MKVGFFIFGQLFGVWEQCALIHTHNPNYTEMFGAKTVDFHKFWFGNRLNALYAMHLDRNQLNTLDNLTAILAATTFRGEIKLSQNQYKKTDVTKLIDRLVRIIIIII